MGLARVPANIKEILLAKSWSKMSQNQFKLLYSVWISDGQNYVFFTTSAKPKVVVYGSCTCPSFARVPVLCFFMLSSTGVPPIANINSNVSKHVLKYMHFHAQFDRCPPQEPTSRKYYQPNLGQKYHKIN